MTFFTLAKSPSDPFLTVNRMKKSLAVMRRLYGATDAVGIMI
jgi:hypothetical protein